MRSRDFHLNYMLHKKDQAFISVPVSRVGLSTRINQLNVPSSRSGSRPATPAAYITSSLNPTRNLPVTSNSIRLKITTQEELEQFENLPITLNLRKFEKEFSDLNQQISSFRENEIAETVERLIHINSEILLEVQILRQHQLLGHDISALEEEKRELDLESKFLLKELISLRAYLKNLPRLPAAPHKESQSPREVSVQTLLDYAMKLAKFSKAPATVLAHNVHPNNYIWPAEDALRRGTLAMASLQPDALVQAEIGEKVEEEEKEDVQMEDVEETPAETKVQRKEQAAPVLAGPTLDLDLFDEDDSD